MSEIVWRDEPPDWHPGAQHTPPCPMACRGCWRETKSFQDERGWLWQCDHMKCPLAARAQPERRRA